VSVCEDGHDQVCYESRYCPACFLKEQAKDQATELKEIIRQLEEKIEGLENTE